MVASMVDVTIPDGLTAEGQWNPPADISACDEFDATLGKVSSLTVVGACCVLSKKESGIPVFWLFFADDACRLERVAREGLALGASSPGKAARLSAFQ